MAESTLTGNLTNSTLMQGIAAAKAGDLANARQLLSQAVQEDPNSERAWFWLSAALKTPQGRAACLRQVLALNPANQTARRGLEALEKAPRAPALIAESPTMSSMPPAPSRRSPVMSGIADQLRLKTAATTPEAGSSTFVRVAKYTLTRLLILCVTVAVGVFLAVVMVNFGGFIDDIFRDQIEWAIAYMSMDMQDVPAEEKFQQLEQVKWQMEEAAGLHEPFLSRCLLWTWRGLTLDWGEASFSVTLSDDSAQVYEVILQRLPNTLLLAGAANLLLFFATVFLALYLSRRYGSFLDKAMIALSPLSSAPNWVHGIILTVVFAAQLHLLPLGGKFDPMPPETEVEYALVVLKHMILPVTAIFLSMFFQSTYAWRTFFLLHAGEDYVELAEAQGLSPRTIERRYVLRPALPYIITSFALMIIAFWQGAMALEVFFDWPGIGQLFVQSIWRLARSTVVALIVIFAYLLAISVFLLDIFYALVDPRVKVGGNGQNPDAALKRTQRRLRLWPRRKTARLQKQTWEPRAEMARADLAKTNFWGRVKRNVAALKPTLREFGRYPSALLGLVTILLLIGVSIYTVVTIPYNEAIEIWRGDRNVVYHNPKNAQPEWVNLLRKNDLPKTIVLNTEDASTLPEGATNTQGTVSKNTQVVTEDMTEVAMSFTFDYPYGAFPQDMAIHLTAHYEEKMPFITLTLLTPDGREIELDSFATTSAQTYLASTDTRLRHRDMLGGEGGQPMHKLFADPEAETEAPVPVQGIYELQVTGFTFEDDSDVDAEFVLYGQVFGPAGTDHRRRDLMTALLWGAPVALAFGLLGAVCTSLLTMSIAAVGVWFGGWVDTLVQRITEVNMILPALPIAITVYLVYAKSVWVILGVMVLLNIFGSALKNYRAMFIQIKEAPYIEAARVYGASNRRIVFRYLVPRIMPVLIPQLVILIPGFVFLEATLAFLGVSDIYLPTWGKVINDALTNNVFQGHYYWVLEPIALLLLTGLAFAMVGFALDRILNPKLRDI